MVLARLAEVGSGVGDDDGGVPDHVALRSVALEDGRDHHHVVLGSQLRRGATGRAGYCGILNY